MSEVLSQNRAMQELAQEPTGSDVLSPEEVKTYLLENPDFFQQQPEVLQQLVVPHEQKGSVSLLELQTEQLRQKVKTLTRKLSQLITIARQNEDIYRIYADLNLRLLKCKSFSDAQDTLDEIMRQKLKMSAVALHSFNGAHALPEIQQKLFVEKRFKSQPFFFGRLSQHEKQLLFSERPAESVALMLLGEKGELGMLAVASKDPSHFNPEMDTLLISQLQKFLQILLPKLAGY